MRVFPLIWGEMWGEFRALKNESQPLAPDAAAFKRERKRELSKGMGVERLSDVASTRASKNCRFLSTDRLLHFALSLVGPIQARLRSFGLHHTPMDHDISSKLWPRVW